MEPVTYNLDPGQPATIQEGKCDLCQHEGLLVWDGVTYVCQDFTACLERGKAIQAEYDRVMIETHLKWAAEYEAELEKHRIPEKDQIWHVGYEQDGDESGVYDWQIYAGSITLFGPFFGFDDRGTQTIEVNSEDDAKFLVEKLNRLIEFERAV
jgi:hypothetical protein